MLKLVQIGVQAYICNGEADNGKVKGPPRLEHGGD
jgi:hypothetical protein